PKNAQVRPVTAPDLEQLFPTWSVEAATTTVLPPLSRRLGRATDTLYPLLDRVRVLHSHLFAVLHR
ncbi:MAG: hypothetical protein AAGK32_22240, partial [Actinomycetota bacterium]